MSAATFPATQPQPREGAQPPLWPHQQEAVAVALQTRGIILEIPMGGGKSRTALELVRQTDATRVLVLCPRGVIDVWPDEIIKYDPAITVWAGQVTGKRGPLKNATASAKATALLDHVAVTDLVGTRFAAIVNFEAAIQPKLTSALLNVQWDLVVIDECHRIKAPGGAQSRTVAKIAGTVRDRGGRVLGLTGTLMPHGPLDVYAQGRAVNPAVFGTSNAVFRARYAGRKMLRRLSAGDPVFAEGPNHEALHLLTRQRASNRRVIRAAVAGEPLYAVGPRGEALYDGIADTMLDEFTRQLERLVFSVSPQTLDELLGLEPPVHTFRTVDLDAETSRVYTDLEEHLITELANRDDTVTAANAMVVQLRLAQVANGFATTTSGDARRILRDQAPEKTRLLIDVLHDIPAQEPVVVFCRFHHDLDQARVAADMTGRRYGELSGRDREGMSGSRMRGDIDLLAVQIQAGGLGIDLTRSRHGIYFSLGFSLGDYDQSRARLRRPGQAHRVVYTHLLAKDTVDEAIYRALRQRKRTIDAVLNLLRARSAA